MDTPTITRADITEAVHREIGLSKTESSALINSAIDHITEALVQGQDVKLTNFGTFKLSDKKPRIGRNPRTGEPALVSKRRVVSFKPAGTFIDRVSSRRNMKNHNNGL
ncbi:integration host factor subunit alpha [Fretibacter rubidus]